VITAADSNVLVDIIAANPAFLPRSLAALLYRAYFADLSLLDPMA
jgi:hypothetical protein